MSNIVKIGGKYYDLGTRNRSFLQTAQELRAVGIKNWYFMLEVKNPQLKVQDMDAHRSDLTQEQIASLTLECKINPWFFFREVAIVPVRGVGNKQPILSRASLALLWCFDHSIDAILCQPRQTYKTTWATLVIEYMFLFEYQKCDIPYLHLTEKRCVDNAEMLRDYITALPRWLNPWYGRKHLPGTKSLKYEQHGTSIAIVSVADSESKAKDKLRGFTLFGGFWDEWEYLPFVGNIMAGGAPAMISAKENARMMGIRTCMIYASTPGDLETSTGRAAQKIIDATPRFSEKMYDMSKEALEKMFSTTIQKEEGEEDTPITRLYIEFNWKQLRKTEAWLKEQYQSAVEDGDISEYRRGILLDRYRGSDTSIFLEEDIEYLTTHTREPDHQIMILDKYVMNIYDHKIQQVDITAEYQYFDINLPYMIGIDIAAGTGGDNTVLIVVNPYTLEIVGEIVSPYLGCSLDLMKTIAVLAKMMPRAVFCPETNSIGKALLEWVQDSQLEYRFYHDPKLDITKNAMVKTVDTSIKLKQKAQMKKYIGTNVTETVRKNMIELLKRYVHDYRHLIYSKELVRDITNLTMIRGKIQADRGAHDDVVMAYCHVLYVLTYGYDLTRFGIDIKLCSYEKAFRIAQEYDNSIAEDVVNNVIPYDNPDAFENQLLADLITGNGSGFDTQTGVDPYGYSRNQYNNRNIHNQQPVLETISGSDISFFQSVNGFM